MSSAKPEWRDVHGAYRPKANKRKLEIRLTQQVALKETQTKAVSPFVPSHLFPVPTPRLTGPGRSRGTTDGHETRTDFAAETPPAHSPHVSRSKTKCRRTLKSRHFIVLHNPPLVIQGTTTTGTSRAPDWSDLEAQFKDRTTN